MSETQKKLYINVRIQKENGKEIKTMDHTITKQSNNEVEIHENSNKGMKSTHDPESMETYYKMQIVDVIKRELNLSDSA